ncbi:hypothetical protein CDAR_604121 [Caerostris darwini]|uniref:Uncharacterized protein n=1 Tax=Caerostris darwini TaxID=1538125 RepID=A0AAV4QSZ9_9ARAC|nr:hypothetical protein CDAR_604121 [Caerostris darwini]
MTVQLKETLVRGARGTTRKDSSVFANESVIDLFGLWVQLPGCTPFSFSMWVKTNIEQVPLAPRSGSVGGLDSRAIAKAVDGESRGRSRIVRGAPICLTRGWEGEGGGLTVATFGPHVRGGGAGGSTHRMLSIDPLDVGLRCGRRWDLPSAGFFFVLGVLSHPLD